MIGKCRERRRNQSRQPNNPDQLVEMEQKVEMELELGEVEIVKGIGHEASVADHQG